MGGVVEVESRAMKKIFAENFNYDISAVTGNLFCNDDIHILIISWNTYFRVKI